ncbi:MAG TPA: hypothetical protein VN688_30410 [Gemmataceae bacterium]|nr:hypothetical protein [Gemmataceae bacterium]
MSAQALSREFDLYVPLHYNDGTPVEDAKLARLRQCLVDRFGGLLDTRQRGAGQWKVGAVTFHDEIVIYRLLATEDAIPFFKELKEEMKREFQQEDVLIVVRKITIL